MTDEKPEAAPLGTGPEFKPEDLYPMTVEDALKKWDEGETVHTIEMGGLGPGYEQAIQIGVIELCRRIHKLEIPEPPKERDPDAPYEQSELDKFLDEHLHAVIAAVEHLDGLSGAQAGAIKNLAYNYCTKGWYETLKLVEKDRWTMVSYHWPRYKDA